MSGRPANIVYMLADALASLKENAATTVLTSFTLGFSLAILSLFVFVISNLGSVLEGWGERTQIVAYVKDSSLPEAASIKDSILKVPGVREASFISKEKALEELKAELKGHESILEGVGPNPLPASFEIKVMDAFREPSALSFVVERLKAEPWVEDVQYSREWVEKFSAFLRFMKLAAAVTGVFLGAAALFIMSNTIRLAVYARKDEIEIMRLVGASDSYVKVPFIVEGVLQGLLGGLLALGILLAGRVILVSQMPAYLVFAVEAPFPAGLFTAALIAAGIAMGVAGSLISMARFLRS